MCLLRSWVEVLCGILEYGGRMMCYFEGVDRILMCYHSSTQELFILLVRKHLFGKHGGR